MVHCGFEATAINDTFRHPLKALKIALRGPNTEGPMAPELPIMYEDQPAVVEEHIIHQQPTASCSSEKQVA